MDPTKDQSYFLCGVDGAALRQAAFPLGVLRKSTVRRLAEEAGLCVAKKRDSYGICFIGERDMPTFLNSYLDPRPGRFRSVDGIDMGEHRGLNAYTVGQSAGLGGMERRWYVVEKEATTDTVIVAEGNDHPALFCRELEVNELWWVCDNPFRNLTPGSKISMRYRARQLQQLRRCEVELRGDAGVVVRFDAPQRAITVGQILALYAPNGAECFGGGVITSRGQSCYDAERRSVAKSGEGMRASCQRA